MLSTPRNIVSRLPLSSYTSPSNVIYPVWRTSNVTSLSFSTGAQTADPLAQSFPTLQRPILGRYRNMTAGVKAAPAVFDDCPDDVVREILQHVGGFPASKRSVSLLLPTLSVNKRFHVRSSRYVPDTPH
jgi:hypothetical protein